MLKIKLILEFSFSPVQSIYPILLIIE